MRIKAIIFSLILVSLTHVGKSAPQTPAVTPQTEAVSSQKEDTLTIRILGDIMMHSRQIELAHKKDSTYDFSPYFSIIKDSLRQADICIANMEFTLAGKPYTGYPSFSAPDCIVDYLDSCGVDVLLCANNHIFDKGSSGAARTLKTIRERVPGMLISGLAADSTDLFRTTPLKITRKGVEIALVNFTYGTNAGADKHWPKTNYMGNRKLIAKALEEASSSDLTIALPHWGTEYVLTPSEEQKSMAGWLAEKGADLIIGSHPHVPQTFESVTDRKVPVAYSLGNAVSNMSAANTQMELMATIRIIRHNDGTTEVGSIGFTYLWCSRPGGYGTSYTIIPIRHFIDKKNEWKGIWDYDKMIQTYNRVKNCINIEDR